MQEQILVGTREIADYMRRSRNVVRRLIKEGMPVSFEHGAYMTTTAAINKWLFERAINRTQI